MLEIDRPRAKRKPRYTKQMFPGQLVGEKYCSTDVQERNASKVEAAPGVSPSDVGPSEQSGVCLGEEQLQEEIDSSQVANGNIGVLQQKSGLDSHEVPIAGGHHPRVMGSIMLQN